MHTQHKDPTNLKKKKKKKRVQTNWQLNIKSKRTVTHILSEKK
jgi:hypothetical protein